MAEEKKEGLIDRLKGAIGRGDGDEVDPIEIERLSLTDTTDSERVDTPAGTGLAEDELPPDIRRG